MASFRDQGLVLRHYNLGEADRIIVLFTRAHGLLRCVAKGVRRTRSRFGARLEPFTLIDVQIYPGRNLNTITEAVTVETFNARIVADYERYTAAASVLEAVERLLGEEEQPNPQLFDLTVGVMGALSYGRRSPQQMVDTYLLRAMAEAGWAPELYKCAVCGAEGPHQAFHPAAGGVVCVKHRPPGSATPMAGVLEYLRSLRDARWDRADSIAGDKKLGRRVQEEAHQLIVSHLQWHTERKITAFDLAAEAERGHWR